MNDGVASDNKIQGTGLNRSTCGTKITHFLYLKILSNLFKNDIFLSG